ncbi:MAG: Hsp20/alpha crystallin family protein [Thermodesulfobacteriota bacterium]
MLSQLRNEAALPPFLHRFGQDLWPTVTSKPQQHPWPATNIHSNEQEIVLQVELPGLSREEVEITIEEEQLEIKGERQAQAPEGFESQRQEMSSGKFSRRFRLGRDIDASKITAALNNGILTLTLPRSEAAQAKKIAIAA